MGLHGEMEMMGTRCFAHPTPSYAYSTPILCVVRWYVMGIGGNDEHVVLWALNGAAW